MAAGSPDDGQSRRGGYRPGGVARTGDVREPLRARSTGFLPPPALAGGAVRIPGPAAGAGPCGAGGATGGRAFGQSPPAPPATGAHARARPRLA